MGGPPLRVERDERGVATVTMDRPEVRNAFDAGLIGALREAFTDLGGDPRVRVVVLTGAGPVFSAGADLDWMRAMVGYSFEDNLADSRELHHMLAAIHGCATPVVARVNGHALGGGAGLVAAADLVVAVRSAWLGFTEVRLGLVPAVISPFVVERIGLGHARRLFLTGERIEAAEAQRIGLVTHLTDPDGLDEATSEVVDALLAAGPEAQAAVKELLPHVAAATTVDEAAEHTVAAIARRRISEEGQQGMRAFLDRRRPPWAPDDG